MKNGRSFRKHMFLEIALPVLPSLVLAALLGAGAVVVLPSPLPAIALVIPALLFLGRLGELYYRWIRYRLVISEGAGCVEEHCGVLRVQRRRIPLNRMVSVEYNQSLWVRLLGLDAGDVVVNAMGGPFEFTRIGCFRDLQLALDSDGMQVRVAARSAPLPAVVIAWLMRTAGRGAATGATVVQRAAAGTARRAYGFARTVPGLAKGARAREYAAHQFQMEVVPPASSQHGRAPARPRPLAENLPDDGYIFRGEPFSASRTSYAGLLAFTQQFVLDESEWSMWRYRARDPRRRYYPQGVTEPVAAHYLERLRQEYILIRVGNGHHRERLSSRVRSIEDVRRILSHPEDRGDVA